MWSDRKQQGNTPGSISGISRSETFSGEKSSGSAGRTEAADSRAVAVVGKDMIVKGQIRSAEHMHVAGEIDGSLYLAGYDLKAFAGSRVQADVTAREVDISGIVHGNVDASRKITVRTGGTLIGDLRTPGIVIEDGAYFKGNIEIVNREARGEADDPAAAAPHSAHASA